MAEAYKELDLYQAQFDDVLITIQSQVGSLKTDMKKVIVRMMDVDNINTIICDELQKINAEKKASEDKAPKRANTGNDIPRPTAVEDHLQSLTEADLLISNQPATDITVQHRPSQEERLCQPGIMSTQTASNYPINNLADFGDGDGNSPQCDSNGSSSSGHRGRNGSSGGREDRGGGHGGDEPSDGSSNKEEE